MEKSMLNIRKKEKGEHQKIRAKAGLSGKITKVEIRWAYFKKGEGQMGKKNRRVDTMKPNSWPRETPNPLEG